MIGNATTLFTAALALGLGPAMSAGPVSPHASSFCFAEPEPPAYYAVELVTTKRVPGTGLASGTGHVTFAASPFGVALAPDGSYLYDVGIELSHLKRPGSGTLVAWATTTQVDQIRRLGALDDAFRGHGQVSWNKFLLVVTLEESDDPEAETWSGPIVMRGMSRSGMMHTMAGHGPFQQENCARYGYN
jgi:hypothetical protein